MSNVHCFLWYEQIVHGQQNVNYCKEQQADLFPQTTKRLLYEDFFLKKCTIKVHDTPIWSYMYMMHIDVCVLKVTSCDAVICNNIGIKLQ